jgi:transcriptional regulator with XRE-family HTH domain
VRKNKSTVTKTPTELARALGLSPLDGAEIEVRAELNDKIIDAVKRRGFTHAEVARLAMTSRTRITAIMNRNTHEVSTDLLLRILGALGYRVRVSFSRKSLAA